MAAMLWHVRKMTTTLWQEPTVHIDFYAHPLWTMVCQKKKDFSDEGANCRRYSAGCVTVHIFGWTKVASSLLPTLASHVQAKKNRKKNNGHYACGILLSFISYFFYRLNCVKIRKRPAEELASSQMWSCMKVLNDKKKYVAQFLKDQKRRRSFERIIIIIVMKPHHGLRLGIAVEGL